uniref:Uncharacterized protein n=1 Tax=Oryza punctata TaxID=4537 RepID=A0A0E0KMW3_ORYPU
MAQTLQANRFASTSPTCAARHQHEYPREGGHLGHVQARQLIAPLCLLILFFNRWRGNGRVVMGLAQELTTTQLAQATT